MFDAVTAPLYRTQFAAPNGAVVVEMVRLAG